MILSCRINAMPEAMDVLDDIDLHDDNMICMRKHAIPSCSLREECCRDPWSTGHGEFPQRTCQCQPHYRATSDSLARSWEGTAPCRILDDKSQMATRPFVDVASHPRFLQTGKDQSFFLEPKGVSPCPSLQPCIPAAQQATTALPAYFTSTGFLDFQSMDSMDYSAQSLKPSGFSRICQTLSAFWNTLSTWCRLEDPVMLAGDPVGAVYAPLPAGRDKDTITIGMYLLLAALSCVLVTPTQALDVGEYIRLLS